MIGFPMTLYKFENKDSDNDRKQSRDELRQQLKQFPSKCAMRRGILYCHLANPREFLPQTNLYNLVKLINVNYGLSVACDTVLDSL